LEECVKSFSPDNHTGGKTRVNNHVYQTIDNTRYEGAGIQGAAFCGGKKYCEQTGHEGDG
jgi:hypothetical protein